MPFVEAFLAEALQVRQPGVGLILEGLQVVGRRNVMALVERHGNVWGAWGWRPKSVMVIEQWSPDPIHIYMDTGRKGLSYYNNLIIIT